MKPHVIQTLPPGYILRDEINLQKDKKTALVVNGAALVIMIAMGFGMNFVVPISQMFGLENGTLPVFVRMLVLVAGYLAYIVLHELTHAAVMRCYGAGKLCFGFTGVYAYAGSKEDYFDKYSYRIIALAPLVVWGFVFGLIQSLVDTSWIWVVWFLQIGNVSGAAGDVYVVLRLMKQPMNVWIHDTGFAMTVWGPAQ